MKRIRLLRVMLLSGAIMLAVIGVRDSNRLLVALGGVFTGLFCVSLDKD